MNEPPIFIRENTKMKVYFVELDDDDRERVLSAHVEHLQLNSEPEWADVHVDGFNTPVSRFDMNQNVTLTAKLVPSTMGVLFTLENFKEEEE